MSELLPQIPLGIEVAPISLALPGRAGLARPVVGDGVDIDDPARIDPLVAEVERDLAELAPEASSYASKFELGPGSSGKVQARITGPDARVLRELGDRVVAILDADPDAKAVRTDWRQRTKVVSPVLAENEAAANGIGREGVAEAIRQGFEGVPVGVFRDRDPTLPSVVRADEAERNDVASMRNVPLALIAVTAGLLLTGQPFGFMALLGFLSLMGMLIKSAIVLIDEIDAQRAAGKPAPDAVVDAGASRLRPVAMAAATTALGMLPLLGDAFFASMAVTIIFGLMVGTVLTRRRPSRRQPQRGASDEEGRHLLVAADRRPRRLAATTRARRRHPEEPPLGHRAPYDDASRLHHDPRRLRVRDRS
ncbi:MAG: efflux RND transporter permease subunit [Thermodesulfobacteriota bacterium]